MNEPIICALVELCAFLEMSSDRIVDPDAAVAQLENVAQHLKKLSDEEQLHFLEVINMMVNREMETSRSTPLVQFLQEFGESMGIGALPTENSIREDRQGDTE